MSDASNDSGRARAPVRASAAPTEEDASAAPMASTPDDAGENHGGGEDAAAADTRDRMPAASGSGDSMESGRATRPLDDPEKVTGILEKPAAAPPEKLPPVTVPGTPPPAPAKKAAAAPPVPPPPPDLFGDDEDDGASGPRMGFMDHLMELRRRLVTALLAVLITTVLCVVFFQPIFDFLRAPIDRVNESWAHDPAYQQLLAEKGFELNGPLIMPTSIDPLDLMMILMKVAIYAGLILSSPVVIYQVWAFISPGLKDRERRAIQPVLAMGLLFFIAGSAFCYYVVFPMTLDFLVWFAVEVRVKPDYTLPYYLSLLTTFMLLFGAVFEIPMVTMVLARLRILSPPMLTHFWRYITLACFILGAILSPGGDPISMVIMSGTLLMLYLLSVGLAKMVYPKDA